MRTALMAAGVLVVLSLLTGQAGAKTESHRQWCKRVREAIWAGHTLEQLTAEFDADAKQIVQCLPRGKGKKSKPPKHAPAPKTHAKQQNS